MKKLLFTLLFTTFTIAAKAQSSNPVSSGDSGKSSYIYIDWGRKSKDCAEGFGICKFQMSITPADLLITVAAIMGGQLGDIPIQVIMNRQYYESNGKQFPNQSFRLDEEYVFTLEEAKSLGFPEGAKIKAGHYKLIFNDRSQTYQCSLIATIK